MREKTRDQTWMKKVTERVWILVGQAAAGLAAGFVGGIMGGILAIALWQPHPFYSDFVFLGGRGYEAKGLIGFLIAFPFSAAWGVHVIGRWYDESAKYWVTWFAAVLGTLTGLGCPLGIAWIFSVAPSEVSIGQLILLTTLGALAGFYWTRRPCIVELRSEPGGLNAKPEDRKSGQS